jgi:hypothetical protein
MVAKGKGKVLRKTGSIEVETNNMKDMQKMLSRIFPSSEQ